MDNNYICKIATVDEMNKKWDYEISLASNNKDNWITWKKENIERFKKGLIIPYYGLLNGEIISECTASIDSSIVQNAEILADKYNADKEVCIIAAWLHDIASITDYDLYEEHHIHGAKIADEITGIRDADL